MKRITGSVLGGVLGAGLAVTTALAGVPAAGHDRQPRHRDDVVTRAFDAATRSTIWTRTATIPLVFPTYHPQGLALVGDKIFLSTVEIIEAPVRYPEPVDGYDRTPGKGRGHVLVLDRQGHLLHDIVLGSCGCRSPSTGRTAPRSSTGSTRAPSASTRRSGCATTSAASSATARPARCTA
jgi:hypothetical protein